MKFVFIAFIAVIFSTAGSAQAVKFFNTKGTAIKGYDPVAYFQQNKAVEGNDLYTYDWSGSKWKFVSQANLDSFKLAPQYYAPQYGGFCAYGCSEDHLSPTDPNAFTIVNNKLYLNYNLDVRKMWQKDTDGRIKAADKNWPALNK
ncbi:MAG: YHS domain-containing (seleno)protein [Ferruginibacter sp.]